MYFPSSRYEQLYNGIEVEYNTTGVLDGEKVLSLFFAILDDPTTCEAEMEIFKREMSYYDSIVKKKQEKEKEIFRKGYFTLGKTERGTKEINDVIHKF